MYQFKNSDYLANYIIIGCQCLTVRDGVITLDLEEKHKYEQGLAHNGFLPSVADDAKPQAQNIYSVEAELSEVEQ